jgi:hypothetical protein
VWPHLWGGLHPQVAAGQAQMPAVQQAVSSASTSGGLRWVLQMICSVFVTVCAPCVPLPCRLAGCLCQFVQAVCASPCLRKRPLCLAMRAAEILARPAHTHHLVPTRSPGRACVTSPRCLTCPRRWQQAVRLQTWSSSCRRRSARLPRSTGAPRSCRSSSRCGLALVLEPHSRTQDGCIAAAPW